MFYTVLWSPGSFDGLNDINLCDETPRIPITPQKKEIETEAEDEETETDEGLGCSFPIKFIHL